MFDLCLAIGADSETIIVDHYSEDSVGHIEQCVKVLNTIILHCSDRGWLIVSMQHVYFDISLICAPSCSVVNAW